MRTPPSSLAANLVAVVRNLLADERGTTTENVIWIAGLAAIALGVVAWFGPQITAAAQSIVFK